MATIAKVHQNLEPKLAAVLMRLCQRLGSLFTTQAAKLPYLVDVVAQHVLGRRIAAGTYETWEHGVVTREVYRFVKHGAPAMLGFRVAPHVHSESGKLIALAHEPGAIDLTPDEIEIVDFVADEYGRIPPEQLGHLTKRLNTHLSPSSSGSNTLAAVNEDAYAHLTTDWQRLSERILAEDLDDRSQWGEPMQDDPLAHLRRALNA